MTTPIALTIAGSDSSGGAGIQADLKTFAALGVYGASVITALTAQNTTGVSGIHQVPAEFVTAQIDAVFADLDVGAVKIGMVAHPPVIDAIVGVSVPNLTGGYSAMMANHHITKPVLIGEIQANGQFDTVWQTSGLVVANEWSPYLPDSKDLIADWRKPMNCGNFNVVTGKCGGKGK